MLRVILALLIVSSMYAKVLTVALASNITYAMPELKKAFTKKYPNIKIREVISGSGKLSAQIMHNAPFDLFLSANMTYPKTLHNKGFCIKKPHIYAKGKLAFLSYNSYDFSNIKGLLLSSKIKTIAIANPTLAPYGKASIEVLKNMNIYEKVKHKIVYAQSIGQTLLYSLNSTDIGIVALSSLKSDRLDKYIKDKNYKQIDSTLYHAINQGIVIIKKSKNNEDAKLFYDFILSEEAKNIFAKYGYDI